MDLRRADFMGTWYPATARECELRIRAFLEDGVPALEKGVLGVGGVVPHAGWSFSGSLAARVLAAMKTGPDPDAVVIFGMHLGPRHPAFLTDRGAFETPFGDLPVAQDLAQALARGFPFQLETPARHVQDNTIELQLPFIKYFFPDTKIVPIGAPPVERSLAMAESVVDLAAHLGLSVKVVGSTDLTHYGPNYGFSPAGDGPAAKKWVREENDRKMVDLLLSLEPEQIIAEGLKSKSACCSGAAASAATAARKLGAARGQMVGYYTSSDVHPSDSFVGYAGILY
ncbi:MAG: AmmeMemoRadiSam system protein B [Proteobacteria bacterium]|nr:AmmeMemoRadiSam system protein B [Pseudomonadota bacterium]